MLLYEDWHMKLSNILSVVSILFFISGLIIIAIGCFFCAATYGTLGYLAMLDTFIGASAAVLGALLILAAFKIAQRVKKARHTFS